MICPIGFGDFDHLEQIGVRRVTATLIAAGVSEVYFHDRGAIKMASPFVTAKPLPETTDNLFEYYEDAELDGQG